MSAKLKEVHLTPKDLSKRLRVSVVTLARWRVKGEGPRFLKMSNKVVLYPMPEIEAWEKKKLRVKTKKRG